MRKTNELQITLQPQVVDTQGQDLNRAGNDIGYEQVTDIREGKALYMTGNEPTAEGVGKSIRTQREKLFANTVIKEYSLKIVHKKKEAQ
ncbi:phosphoribosylformylglycinamidine synthase subunit PurS [Staphylococcus epidermidis]